jgi:hypothetical protein
VQDISSFSTAGGCWIRILISTEGCVTLSFTLHPQGKNIFDWYSLSGSQPADTNFHFLFTLTCQKLSCILQIKRLRCQIFAEREGKKWMRVWMQEKNALVGEGLKNKSADGDIIRKQCPGDGDLV